MVGGDAMKSVCTVALVIASLVIGWTVGRAQNPSPDFELIVNAPGGETSVECVRGCGLQWVQRGLNPNSAPAATFTFSCGASECSSGRIGGWLQR
jgi:hypothetical protein